MPMTDPAPAEQFNTLEQQRHAGLMGMWVFLITELLLFGGVFGAFTVLKVLHEPIFAEAAHHLDLMLGTINTVLLLTSGLTMALAEQAVAVRRRGLGLAFLLSTIALGIVFLGIKAYEWHHEYTEKLLPVLDLPFDYPGEHPEVAELFFNFYYAMTGMHAAHMLIGIVVMAVMAALVARWREPGKLDRQIHVVGLYWAFVDVVWIFVFTVLYLLRG